MDKKLEPDKYIKTGDRLVYEYNHGKKPLPPKFKEDPTSVRDADGNLIGFQWVYGDRVSINIYLEETTLSTIDSLEVESDLFIHTGLVTVEFLGPKDEVVMSLTQPASPVTTFIVNDSDETTLERNTYRTRAFFWTPKVVYNTDSEEEEIKILNKRNLFLKDLHTYVR